MKSIWEYKNLFITNWIDITEDEVSNIIKNIDEIGSILFQKFLDNVNKAYEEQK